jgi:type III secretion protein V
MPGLQPGELLVDAPLGQMEALGLRGGPAMNPADGRLCTIVAEQDRPAVAGAGLVSWTAAEWLALFVAGEIRRMANRHLDIVEVEYKLAQLDEFSPDLVQATLQRYSPADLTVVLRALLSEGLSIRDLPLLLGLLLQYDTIPVDANTTVVLDDRLPVAEASTGQPAEEQARYLAFVRQGLKRYLSYHYAKDLVGLAVFRLEPEFEATARAANANAALFDEAEQEAVRDAVWAAIGDEPRRKRTPVLVRGPTTRMAVRRLLAPELPDLPIVAQEELLPGIAIRPVSTIDIERSLVNAAPSRRSS